MIQEQIESISGSTVYTASGPKVAIGNARHRVGDWVWCDNGCVFGSETVRNNVPVVILDPVILESYINYSPYGNKYRARSATNPSKTKYDASINSPYAYGYFVYDQHKAAEILYPTTELTFYILSGGQATQYSAQLPDGFDCDSSNSYFEIDAYFEAGLLNIFLLLYDRATVYCKILHYLNNVLSDVKDFSSTVASLLSSAVADANNYTSSACASPTITWEGVTKTTGNIPGNVNSFTNRKVDYSVNTTNLTPDVEMSYEVSLLDSKIIVKISVTLTPPATITVAAVPPVINIETRDPNLVSTCVYSYEISDEVTTLLYHDKSVRQEVNPAFTVYYKSADVAANWYETGWVNLSYVSDGRSNNYNFAMLSISGYSIVKQHPTNTVKITDNNGWELDITNYVPNAFTKPLICVKGNTIYLYGDGKLLKINKDSSTVEIVHSDKLLNLQIPAVKLSSSKIANLFGNS